MDLPDALGNLPATVTTGTKALAAGGATLLVLAVASGTGPHRAALYAWLCFAGAVVLFGAASISVDRDEHRHLRLARAALGRYLLDTRQLVALEPARIDLNTARASCQAVTETGLTVDVDVTWRTETLTPGAPLARNLSPVTVRIRP